MVAAGVGIWAPGESPGTEEEALAAVKLLLELGGGAVNDVDKNGDTALHGAVHRGGSIADSPVPGRPRRAGSTSRNNKGWTPLTIADGIEYTPDVFKRYPETAEALRRMMREHGLTVPEPNPTPAVGSSRNRRE